MRKACADFMFWQHEFRYYDRLAQIPGNETTNEFEEPLAAQKCIWLK